MFRFLTALILIASLMGCLAEQEPADVGPLWNPDNDFPVNSSVNQNGEQPEGPGDNFLLPKINTYPRAAVDNFSLMEDSTVLLRSVLLNDYDIDGDPLTIVGFSQGEWGGRVVKIATNLYRYIPAPDFNGVEVITYTVTDGNGGEAMASVNITVTPVDDFPLAKPDSLLVTVDLEETFNILANDFGLGDSVEVSVVVDVRNGTLTSLGGGEFTYTPFDGYLGEDSFIYEIVDANGDASEAIVTLQVGCVDRCRVFTLSWDASISTDIVAYKIYAGVDGEELSLLADVGNVLGYEYFTHQMGDYAFAVSAVNAQNIESELSFPPENPF